MTAVSCGTPTPGHDARRCRSSPARCRPSRRRAPRIDQRAWPRSAVATLPATSWTRVGELLRSARPRRRPSSLWPCAVSITIRSHSASISASVRSKPLSPTVVAAATRSRPAPSLVACGIVHRLLDILDRDQSDAAIGVVHHQQLLDAPLVQQAGAPLPARRRRGRSPDCACVISSRTGWLPVLREADVAIGQDTDQLARATRPPECR